MIPISVMTWPRDAESGSTFRSVINVSFLIVPYSKFKPTKHAYHWKKGLAQWIILIMIAENAAMDDDNEAGMALCDCLSEYQDDTGEWWHREQRSQRYPVTLRLNIPIKVVPAPGPGPTWHRLNTKPENLASVPGTRAGGWSRLFKISEFICFWWGCCVYQWKDFVFYVTFGML